MPALFIAPTEMHSPLIVGKLEPVPEVMEKGISMNTGEFPQVSIGNIDIQPINFKPEDIEVDTKIIAKQGAVDANVLSLSNSSFYLVQFSCTFDPISGKTIEIARFTVNLQPDEEGRQAIAEDLYPNKVEQEINDNFKVYVAPTLKFQEAEATIGGVEHTVDYKNMRPTIIAYRDHGGGAKPTWEFRAQPGYSIEGTRTVYLLMRVPKHSSHVEARLELHARIKQDQGKLMTWLNPRRSTAKDGDIVTLV